MIATYGAPDHGLTGSHTLPVRGATPATLTLTVPRVEDCPRCVSLGLLGDAVAAVLMDDGYCVAPYVHSLPE